MTVTTRTPAPGAAGPGGAPGGRSASAPLVALLVGLVVVAVAVHRDRWALDLAGGRVLPLDDLAGTWSTYLAGWHPVGGGSGAPAPAALAVVGLLGLPFGSPAAAVSVLVLAAVPLSGLTAYLATRALPVGRTARAAGAGAYALLPAGTAGAAQGRLDVVVAQVLLPLVLAGVLAVLRGAAERRAGGWFATAAATALGLAVISAFAPVLHLVVLVLALIGFVVAPAPAQARPRRATALFVVVLLPLGMLLPWAAVVLQRPSVLVHGTGAVVPEADPGWGRLLALDPGGPGAAGWAGLFVLAAAVLAVLLRPTLAMLPGAGLAALGGVVAVLLTRWEVAPLVGGAPRPGFAGAPLLVAGCGLVWVALLGVRTGAGPDRSPDRGRGGDRAAAVPVVVAGAAGLVALAAGAVAATGGPLAPSGPGTSSPARPALAAEVADRLAAEGTSLLVVGEADEPVRLTRDGPARFGDDDIAPYELTTFRLDDWADALRDGGAAAAPVLAQVAGSGVEFVVLPSAEAGARVLAAAGPVATAAPPTADGRPVLQLRTPSPGAELLGPELARRAGDFEERPTELGPDAVQIPVRPPSLAARVEAGPEGRMLVLAVNDEPGWRVVVGGEEQLDTVKAWAHHQVGVLLPPEAVEVRIDRSEVGRASLLLAQAAVVLLTVGTALPARRLRGQPGPGDPSTESGSTPR